MCLVTLISFDCWQFREEQIDAISNIIDRIAEFRSQMNSQSSETRGRVTDCTALVTQLVIIPSAYILSALSHDFFVVQEEKLQQERKRISDLISKLSSLENRMENNERDCRELQTFREAVHSWSVCVIETA